MPSLTDPATSALTQRASDAFISTLAEVEQALEVRWNLRTASVQQAAKDSISQIGTYRLFAEQDREVFVSNAYAEMRVIKEKQRVTPVDPLYFRAAPVPAEHELGAVSPAEALETDENGFCLLGAAGGGKSTILRYLSVQAGEGRKFRGKVRIPFFRRAQDLAARGQSIRDGLNEFFSSLDQQYAVETADRALKKGYMMIVIDGLDEVDEADGYALVSEMSNLSHDAS
ncbi:MAG TPA: NACHT domain-containing protein, partial [Longimicrobium sp.]|nr:NACHT domain-containing protein [Longimicrobium sp.]